MVYRSLLIVASILLFLVGIPLKVEAEIALQTVTSNLSQPIFYTDSNDGSQRTFIVEKEGKIRILSGGGLIEDPFLDLSSKISTEGERGLLGLAFDPLFKTNRRFFVFYTRLDGTIVVSSFLVSASNPNIAELSSERQRIRIPHAKNSNHNGGHIAFGPDNFLYIAVGDGGGAGDEDGNGQNRKVLLGKLLRIDVSRPTGYSIPKTNPFRGVKGSRGEIFAYGLRNPWKFSFDTVSKNLFLGDVGQNEVEEVNIVKSKNNLGWKIVEGNRCFSPSSGCNQRGLTKPIATYRHDEGQSVTGGYVYRGSISSLQGKYIFGDFVSGAIWTLTRDSKTRRWTRQLLLSSNKSISSFGQDRDGEVYVVDFSGEILKIVEN